MSETCRRCGRGWGMAFWLVVLVAVFALPVGAEEAGPPALVVLNTTNEPAMRAALTDVAHAGGIVRHSFPPHVAIVSLPVRAEAVLVGNPAIDFVARGAVEPESWPTSYGQTARDAAAAWNEEYISPRAPAALTAGRPLTGDVRVSPRQSLARRPGAAVPAPPGADQWQTSEYLMGSTAISLIFLESNGAIDANTEDWAPAEASAVVAECLDGTNWWASMYPYAVSPLSFTWEYHYAVPTRYEPISRTSWDDTLWIADALTQLGYPCSPATYWDALYEYLNDIRDAHGTDWAYAVFVVDSSNDADGMFSDGYFAYAWINGPHIVMTYDNDGWGIGNMDSVLAHETGHIFGAADEYCQPGYSCCDPTEYDGYLRILNSNCGLNPICLMNDNSWALCTVTRQQLGWRESDSDGIPDILDVPPTATLNGYSPDPTNDASPTFTGSVSVGYFPNQNPWYNGPDITLNRIANVQYRIDGGPWFDCTPTDGAFDEATESYSFTTDQLADDTYLFEVRAVDTSGNTTALPYPSDTLTVLGHAITIALVADPLVIPSAGSVELSASATDQKGHSIAAYSWDDGGAGGVFLPSVTTTGPAYVAPENTTGADLSVTLTVAATCDGDPPTTNDSSVTITVKFDFDGDGMPDYWEQANGLDQTSPSDAALDADGDGLTNLEEYQDGTNPGSADTDEDGIPDSWELQHGMDPTSAGDASADADHDGLTAVQEYGAGSDPADRDTDSDGFGDAEEVTLGSDPADASDKPTDGHFSDVDPSGYGPGADGPFWAFHEIEACFRSGIVTGYTDGTYQPSLAVSRDQMAVYLARSLAGGDGNVPRDYTVPSFTDVAADYWAFPYIEYAVERNIVRGYAEGDYRPLLLVDRGTMAVYMARAYAEHTGDDLDAFERPALPTFADVPTQEWFYKEVEYCVARGVAHGYDDLLYHPENVVSRDQMAVYISRAFDLPM